MRTIPVILFAIACGAGSSGDGERASFPADVQAVSMCQENGWTERAFLSEGAFGFKRRELAADFTIPTTQGDWTFSEQFSGCESYVFIPDSLVVSPLDDTPLLESQKDLKQLLSTGPRNTHYFFVSMEDSGKVGDFTDGMDSRIEGVLSKKNEANRSWWSERLHVVTKGSPRIKNWVSDAMTASGQGFAIDRFQKLRAFGGLADVTRPSNELNSAGAWPWEANLAYIGHEALYYNFEAEREDELALTDWTVRYLFVDEHLAGSSKTHVDVDLPDAATMATFDTMLIDLTHACDNSSQEFGNCDAWDAVQKLALCRPDDPDTCDMELARYITTYHREGRWLADASQLLPWLKEGGVHRMQVQGSRHGHDNTVRILLGNQGKGAVPFALEELWKGGSWNADYNANHPPVTIDVPADAKRVYLQALLSGHGMSDAHNCAEFCDHQHTFTVGGGSFVASHPAMGDQEGCLKQIGLGTVPNQNGTWWYERSSWCPGKQVDPWVFDITEHVTPGQIAQISYTTNYENPAFGGSINLATWVIYHR